MGSILKKKTNTQILIEIKFHWMGAHVRLQNVKDRDNNFQGKLGLLQLL